MATSVAASVSIRPSVRSASATGSRAPRRASRAPRRPLLGRRAPRLGRGAPASAASSRVPALGDRRQGAGGVDELGELAAHRCRSRRAGGRHARRLRATARSSWPRRAAISASAVGQLGQRCSLSASAASADRRRCAGGRLTLAHRRVGGFEVALLLVEPGEDRLLSATIRSSRWMSSPSWASRRSSSASRSLMRASSASSASRGEQDPLQGGAGAGRGIAQIRQGARGHRLVARRAWPARRRARSAAPLASPSAASASRKRLGRGEPAKVQHSRLGLADLAGEVAVAHRLARLPLQRCRAAASISAITSSRRREVLLGGAEAQLGLVAAVVQAGDAGGFLEQGAAVDCGLAAISSPILPWPTIAGECAPVEASAKRSCTSRARTSRPLIR